MMKTYPCYVMPDETVVAGENAYEIARAAWFNHNVQQANAQRTMPVWPQDYPQTPVITKGGTGTI